MAPTIEDMNVALAVAIEQRNAAQNQVIDQAVTIAQLRRQVAAMEKEAKEFAKKLSGDAPQLPTGKRAGKNGAAEHASA